MGIGLIAGGLRFSDTEVGIDQKWMFCFLVMTVIIAAQASITGLFDSPGTADSQTGVVLKINRVVSNITIPLHGFVLTSDHQGSLTLLFCTSILLCALRG